MAKRKYSTAYGQNRAKKARSARIGAALNTTAGVAHYGAAVAEAFSKNGSGGMQLSHTVLGHIALKRAKEQRAIAKSAKAKAYAIDHLVNYSRRNRDGGSQKQSDASGIVKGHYSTSASGKSFFVKQHTRKSRMA